MKDIFFFNIINCGRVLYAGFFLRRRSHAPPLKKTKLKLWCEWSGAALGMLALLLAAQVAQVARCDVKNNAPAFIRHDLTASYCELCGYKYSTVTIFNPYDGVYIKVLESLGSSGLAFDPNAPMPVTYRVDGSFFLVSSATLVSSANGSILTLNATQIPDLGRLDDRTSNNQSNTINALAANNVELPGSSPRLVASNNIFDFIVTCDFAACIIKCPWEDTYERYANTPFYLGGNIWKCC